MKSSLTLLPLIACLLASPVSVAAKGEVVYIETGCDYYILQSSDGFALVEHAEGPTPSADDVIVGDFESYGKKQLFNRTSRERIEGWVVDFWLAQDEAMQMYLEQCRR
ncbi:MAG TPA: hypothetical protein DEO49_01825 [Sutterella sp.]|nr:hypothetical protein [Sutterella sp.]